MVKVIGLLLVVLLLSACSPPENRGTLHLTDGTTLECYNLDVDIDSWFCGNDESYGWFEYWHGTDYPENVVEYGELENG